MITRKIGAILRGKATPFQLMAASILAGLMGFMPGWAQAPGLLALFSLVLILINANLGIAVLVGIVARLVSLLLMPVSFAIGRFLLDGPTQGFFQMLINAPVFALFGFEYYATTGGLVLGVLFGIGAGWLIVKGVRAFRIKMADLEKASEKFLEFNRKAWVKALKFIFVGGSRGKKTYEELMEKKVGNPVRPLGAVFVVLSLVLLVMVQLFASGPIVTAALRNGLERANGATVDMAGAELNLRENRLVVTGLALADPNALGQNLFQAERLEADVSSASLLRKRLRLDRLVISSGAMGEARRVPGKRIGKHPEPPAEPPPGKEEGEKSIDEYLDNAKQWKERLQQVKKWLEKLSGPERPEDTEAGGESLEDRLRRAIEEQGYARVAATHLVEGSPTLAITELLAEKVRTPYLEDETLDVQARNLSTQPWLLSEAPEVSVKSSGDSLSANLLLGGSSAGRSGNEFQFHFNGLETDQVAKHLSVGGQPPIRGGTLDVASKGSWKTAGGVVVDLPLSVTLHNVEFTLPEIKGTTVEKLTVPIGVEGPLDNPRIKVESKEFANALAKAGLTKAKEELSGRALKELNKQLDGKVDSKTVDDAKNALKGLFGGDKKKKDE